MAVVDYVVEDVVIGCVDDEVGCVVVVFVIIVAVVVVVDVVVGG